MLQDFFKYMWLYFALLLRKIMKKSKLDFCFFSIQIKGSLYSPTRIKGLRVRYIECVLCLVSHCIRLMSKKTL